MLRRDAVPGVRWPPHSLERPSPTRTHQYPTDEGTAPLEPRNKGISHRFAPLGRFAATLIDAPRGIRRPPRWRGATPCRCSEPIFRRFAAMARGFGPLGRVLINSSTVAVLGCGRHQWWVSSWSIASDCCLLLVGCFSQYLMPPIIPGVAGSPQSWQTSVARPRPTMGWGEGRGVPAPLALTFSGEVVVVAVSTFPGSPGSGIAPTWGEVSEAR